MEIKHNDSTKNRPEGERKIDSPALLIDLSEHIEQIKNENAWKDSDRNAITLFKSDKLRIVLIALHRKAEMKTEKPENILSIQVLKGKINVIADNIINEAGKDQLMALHAKVPYVIKALKKSIFLLTLVE